jgi:hypothetical protein
MLHLGGEITMKTVRAVFVVIALCVLCSVADALYRVSDRGEWSKNWPRELEPLRKQARTLVGPTVDRRHYAIRFTRREEFEAVWSHLLKVKSKGAPIFLVRGENFFLGENRKAGVVIHCPSASKAGDPIPLGTPIDGVENLKLRWMNANYLELVVDGDIVDLNRISLPADTPIVDERFKNDEKK